MRSENVSGIPREAVKWREKSFPRKYLWRTRWHFSLKYCSKEWLMQQWPFDQFDNDLWQNDFRPCYEAIKSATIIQIFARSLFFTLHPSLRQRKLFQLCVRALFTIFTYTESDLRRESSKRKAGTEERRERKQVLWLFVVSFIPFIDFSFLPLAYRPSTLIRGTSIKLLKKEGWDGDGVTISECVWWCMRRQIRESGIFM